MFRNIWVALSSNSAAKARWPLGAGKLQRLYALLWKLVAETASAPQAEGGMGGKKISDFTTLYYGTRYMGYTE